MVWDLRLNDQKTISKGIMKDKIKINEPLHLALADEAYSRRYPDIFMRVVWKDGGKKLDATFCPNLNLFLISKLVLLLKVRLDALTTMPCHCHIIAGRPELGLRFGRSCRMSSHVTGNRRLLAIGPHNL